MNKVFSAADDDEDEKNQAVGEEDLTESVTLEMDPEGREGGSHEDAWEKLTSGRGKN